MSSDTRLQTLETNSVFIQLHRRLRRHQLFERFTDRARRLVVVAQEEARELGHDFIGTEHYALAVIHQGEGMAFDALVELGLPSLDELRDVARERMPVRAIRMPTHLPFTPRSKWVHDVALREALHVGDGYIGSEHFLLALTRLPEREDEVPAGATVLFEHARLDGDAIRTKVHELMRRDGRYPDRPELPSSTPTTEHDWPHTAAEEEDGNSESERRRRIR